MGKRFISGTLLPRRPFKVVCVDNSGREEEGLVNGRIYTVVAARGGDCDIAGPDFHLREFPRDSFAIRRFELAEWDTSDWRTWRDHGLEPGHCVCRCPRELCDIHRDQPT